MYPARRAGRSKRHLKRAGAIVCAALAVGVLALVFRTLSAGGAFAQVHAASPGRCELAARLAVRDIAVDGRSGLAFLAVAGRQPSLRDGIYLFDPAHPHSAPVRLPGVPGGLRPNALSLWRDPAAGLMLFAASPGARSGAIDIFAVRLGAHPALQETATIGSSLLAHVRAVAAVGPERFYAAAAPVSATDFFSLLRSYLQPATGRIIYYDGQLPHIVATGLRVPRGLALSADGSKLYVGAAIARTLESYAIEPFIGHLTHAGSYPLPLAPAHLSLDGAGLLVAGDPKLFARARFEDDPDQPSPSDVIHVNLVAGLPQGVRQVYADGGHSIGAAGTAVQDGSHLLVGSALGGQLVSCSVH